MDLRYLTEAQASNFDSDYHSPSELSGKVACIRSLMQNASFSILDLGGGNGHFLDALLDEFPNATGTVLDVSPHLIGLNRKHVRKTLVTGNVENLLELFPPSSFDVITINWVMHHMVGRSYGSCRQNCLAILDKCRTVLKPNGILVVAENMYGGHLGSNIPSWIIYTVTSIRAPWFVAISKRFFNTAGVGVCFRSETSWRRLFQRGGYQTVADARADNWLLSPKERFLFSLLGVNKIYCRHFYLRPA